MITKRGATILFLVGVAVGVLVSAAAWWLVPGLQYGGKLPLDTAYQAVVLTNGDIYYGQLDHLGSAYPVLTDVYYIRRRDREDQKPQFVLIKRGKEWHRPDRMLLNASQILLIEPVNPDSDVAKFIKESKKE